MYSGRSFVSKMGKEAQQRLHDVMSKPCHKCGSEA